MEHIPGFAIVIIALLIFIFWILLPIVAFSIYQRLGRLLRLQEEQTEYLRASTNALIKLASEVENGLSRS